MMRRPLTRFIGRGFLVALAALFALPEVASAEEEHPYHRYRVYHRRKVVVVHPPPPPPRRRLHVVQPRPHRKRARRQWLGVGIRVAGAAMEGTKIGLTDLENPAMGGVGVHIRSQFSDHWGLELSADFLTSAEDQGFTQRTFPVMLSAMFFLFSDSAINPYALAGIGVHFTKLEYMGGLFEHHFLEVAGQLGVGVRVKLGDHFAIHGDIRFLTIYKNLGSTVSISQECLQSKAGATGFCSGLNTPTDEDKFNIGAQFQAGATYYF